MDPGGTAYYSMENYVDNRGNRFYLSPGTIASLGLPWTGDPTGFTPPPSWDYGAFFDASCNAAMIEFTKFEILTSLKRIIRDREDDNKIAEKYGLNSVTLMLNLTVPLDNKWYYHDPDDKGNGDGTNGDKSKSSSVVKTAKEQAGNVGLGLGVIGYEMGKSSSLGFSKLGNMVGHAGDALGAAGIYFDYRSYKAGEMSGGRFSYHAGSFIASFTISRAIGTAAGLETGGGLFYLEAVQLEGQVLWNSFKASYNSWYQQSVMTIENGGNPFLHMHYSF